MYPSGEYPVKDIRNANVKYTGNVQVGFNSCINTGTASNVEHDISSTGMSSTGSKVEHYIPCTSIGRASKLEKHNSSSTGTASKVEKHDTSSTSRGVEKHSPGDNSEHANRGECLISIRDTVSLHDPSQAEIAFPTESKIKAKQLRKQGHEPTKRKTFVEAHYDDLGDDLTGLGGDVLRTCLQTIYQHGGMKSQIPTTNRRNLLQIGYETPVTDMPSRR